MNRVEELESLQRIRNQIDSAESFSAVQPVLSVLRDLTDLVSELAFKISMPPYTEIREVEKR